MPILPNPDNYSRKMPSSVGPSGYLRATPMQAPTGATSIGNALQQAGNELSKYAEEEKARMDTVAVDDAKNQYLQESIVLEGEYSKIRGKTAFDQDIVKDYRTKVDAISERLAGGLKNDSQKRAWESYSGRAKVKFTAGVLDHKLRESDAYAVDTYKATNATRTQNAHSNWADPATVNNSAADIVANIAKEKVRAGWGEERTEVELRNSLGPLWSGVAVQQINAKQYDMAKETLEQHKEVIGVDKYTSYQKSIQASEVIDLSQEKSAEIIGTVQGDSAQRAAAREIGGALGDETLKRVKTFQNEERIQRQENKRVQSENDLKWVSDTGVESLGAGTLTVGQVKSAGLSDQNEALWMTKVFNQGASQNKEKATKQTKDTYADWIQKVTLEPEKYTAEDIAKDIDPNGGGLSGPQFTNIVGILEGKKKPETTASSAAVRGKSQLKAMYDRGDFGRLGTGKESKKTEAWETYSNILIEYQQKTIEEPTVDHTDWFNNRIEEEGTNALYKKLDADFSIMGFGDERDEIITEWLTKRGKATSQRNIDAVRKRYQAKGK